MSVMSRIRNNLALVAIVIAIAILAFVVQDGLSKLIGGSRGVEDAGVIAGQPVTAEEFRLKYNNALENQRRQTGGSLSDAQRNNVLNQTWQSMVSDVIYKKELGDVGLKVSGAELADMFAGNNISPYVENYFSGYFQSVGKQFSGKNIVEYIDLLEQNGTPEMKLGFKEFETNIKEFRAQERYRNMVKAGFIGSDSLAATKFRELNKKADIAFLAVNYTSIPDSTVEVIDADFTKYIAENKAKYKQEEETNIRYVKFDIIPTKGDSNRAYNDVLKLKDMFSDVTDDSVWTSNKSRIPFSGVPAEIFTLPAAIQNQVANADLKTVVGPYLDADHYKLYKLVSTEASDDSYSKIRHIVIRPTTATKEDSAKAESEARGVRNQIRGGADFAALAAEKSQDYTKDIGGNLGWYRKTSFGPDFDDAVDNASVGSVIGPIKSNQGYHIIKVVDRVNKKYAIAEIEKRIFASSATVNEADKKANQFTASAMQSGSIETAAAEANLATLSSGPLVASSTSLPGITENTREIITWALNANNNELSNEIFRAGDAFVLAQVTGKKAEGTKSLDDVRAQIRTQVLNKKKAEIILSKLNGLDNSDLAAMQTAYGEGATIDNTTNISFNSSSIPKIGNDPYIVGKVMGMGVNDVSAPIEGTNGVFVVQVTNITPGAAADELSIKSTLSSEVTSGQSIMQSRTDQALRELADIKDSRFKAGF